MANPPQQRDLSLLRPDFRMALEQYLAAVQAAFPEYGVGVHETLRSPERQAFLFEQGRSRPGPVVTWTLDSNHLYGIAADWHFTRAGQAVWDSLEYRQAYRRVPPAAFGLETLAPAEYVHIQLLNANQRRGEEPAAAPPERLLVVYGLDNQPVAEVELPATGNVRLITTVSADGKRLWVRPEIT